MFKYIATGIAASFAIILLGAMLGWFGQGLSIVSRDIEREVTQHSRQYTEAKGNLLMDLFEEQAGLTAEIAEFKAAGQHEVAQAKRAQQLATIARMRREADMIPASQVPSEVRALLDRS